MLTHLAHVPSPALLEVASRMCCIWLTVACCLHQLCPSKAEERLLQQLCAAPACRVDAGESKLGSAWHQSQCCQALLLPNVWVTLI